jgi:hypothetical protein
VFTFFNKKWMINDADLNASIPGINLIFNPPWKQFRFLSRFTTIKVPDTIRTSRHLAILKKVAGLKQLCAGCLVAAARAVELPCSHCRPEKQWNCNVRTTDATLKVWYNPQPNTFRISLEANFALCANFLGLNIFVKFYGQTLWRTKCI